jgi:hypothetical protein
MNITVIFATLVKSGNVTDTSNFNHFSITNLDTHGYLLLCDLSWLWWLLNRCAYRTIQHEPSYVRYVWTSNAIGLFITGVISCIGLKYPSCLLGDTTFVIFFLTISLFGGCCFLIWGKLFYRAWSSSRTITDMDAR